MNNDKCFCHLNGLAVKDAYARQEIENLKNNSGGSGGKIYVHNLSFTSDAKHLIIAFQLYSSISTPFTDTLQLKDFIYNKGIFLQHFVGCGTDTTNGSHFVTCIWCEFSNLAANDKNGNYISLDYYDGFTLNDVVSEI